MRTLIDVSLFVHTRCAWHGKQYFTSATIVVAQSDRSSVLPPLSVFLSSLSLSVSPSLFLSFPPLLVLAIIAALSSPDHSSFSRAVSYVDVSLSLASGRNLGLSHRCEDKYIASNSHVYVYSCQRTSWTRRTYSSSESEHRRFLLTLDLTSGSLLFFSYACRLSWIIVSLILLCLFFPFLFLFSLNIFLAQKPHYITSIFHSLLLFIYKFYICTRSLLLVWHIYYHHKTLRTILNFKMLARKNFLLLWYLSLHYC